MSVLFSSGLILGNDNLTGLFFGYTLCLFMFFYDIRIERYLTTKLRVVGAVSILVGMLLIQEMEARTLDLMYVVIGALLMIVFEHISVKFGLVKLLTEEEQKSMKEKEQWRKNNVAKNTERL